MKDNYSAWQIDIGEFFKKRSKEEQAKFLLNFAVLAPSSHNSQPWNLKVTNDPFSDDIYYIHVRPDMSRFLGVSDITGREMFISLGCAVEDMLVAADYYGIKTNVSYFSSSYNSAVTISLDFNSITTEHMPNKGDHLIFAILKRRTNRNKYDSTIPLMGSWAINSLDRVKELNVSCLFVSDNQKRSAITDVVMGAMDEAMSNRGFRRELSPYIKSNYTSSYLGMPGFGMGIPGPVSLFLPFLIKNFNMFKLSRKEDEALLKDHTKMFGIVATKHDSPKHWLAAGQAYQCIALEAVNSGLQTAVMAAAIEMGDHYKKLQEILGISERPQVFFRIGLCEKEVHPSPRIKAEDLLARGGRRP